jgi:hypothetical protein|tara:strand:- start:13060 stop:13170 length:111 start_codon:yes stop_codon:yes gene_type:complete
MVTDATAVDERNKQQPNNKLDKYHKESAQPKMVLPF